MKRLFNYFVVFSVFSDAIAHFGSPLGALYPSFFVIILVLFIWPAAWKNIFLNKAFFAALSSLIVLSLVNIYLGSDTVFLLLKQIMGIGISSLTFYILLRLNKYDALTLFKIYLNIAVTVAAIGLIQEASYMVRFTPGYNFSYFLGYWNYAEVNSVLLRVNSIMTEASGFALVMMPAFFVALVSLFNKPCRLLNNWQSLVIILPFLLTFSSVGYLGIIFAGMLILYNYNRTKYILLGVIMILVFSLLAYSYSVNINVRVRDSYNILVGATSLKEVNLSSYALFSNIFITFKSFSESPIIGSGLGSHELSYYRYFESVIGIGQIDTLEPSRWIFNAQDANSLFLRLLSETGLLGLVLVLVFIVRFYLKRDNDPTNSLWVINNAVLCLFFIRLVRSGHYFDNGFFFFIWIYYFSKRNAKAPAQPAPLRLAYGEKNTV